MPSGGMTDSSILKYTDKSCTLNVELGQPLLKVNHESTGYGSFKHYIDCMA
jgi:hypothetical protein